MLILKLSGNYKMVLISSDSLENQKSLYLLLSWTSKIVKRNVIITESQTSKFHGKSAWFTFCKRKYLWCRKEEFRKENENSSSFCLSSCSANLKMADIKKHFGWHKLQVDFLVSSQSKGQNEWEREKLSSLNENHTVQLVSVVKDSMKRQNQTSWPT